MIGLIVAFTVHHVRVSLQVLQAPATGELELTQHHVRFDQA